MNGLGPREGAKAVGPVVPGELGSDPVRSGDGAKEFNLLKCFSSAFGNRFYEEWVGQGDVGDFPGIFDDSKISGRNSGIADYPFRHSFVKGQGEHQGI